MRNDTKVSAAIMNIRVSAGANPNKCGICGRTPDSPARRTVDGIIVEGCVAAPHTGHLPKGSDTAAWHNRPEAQAMRADTLAFLQNLNG